MLNVKRIQDIMRTDIGVDGDAQRISQITWMLFLRIFDGMEEEAAIMDDSYRSPLPDGCRWSAWAADAEGLTGDDLISFVNNTLFPTLADLADTARTPRGRLVGRIMKDSANYMKSGILLRQVINEISQLDYTSQKERHLFNDVYETILRDLQNAGNAGEYYTPRAVTQFMIDMVDPRLGETILDPACGTGGFLVCAYEHIKNHYVKTVEEHDALRQALRGVEKKPLPYTLSVTNLISHGIEVPGIDHDNSLSRPIKDHPWRDKIHVIVTNPPFGGKEEDGIENNFPAAYKTKETADLFLYLITELLAPGGRAAVVLPDGFLFGEGVKTRIKEKLLSECNLHTIVRLPNGVFAPYTGINTNLLFFTKGEPTEEIWYYEHPYPEGYKSYSKTKPIRIEEFAPEKEWWNRRETNDRAWRVTIGEVKDRGYNLDSKNPSILGDAHRDPAELLAEYHRATAAAQTLRDKVKHLLAAALEDKP